MIIYKFQGATPTIDSNFSFICILILKMKSDFKKIWLKKKNYAKHFYHNPKIKQRKKQEKKLTKKTTNYQLISLI